MAKKAATRTATRSRKPAAKRAAARTPDNMSVWKGIVTKAWKDPAFRDRLIDDPNGVLAEYGFKQKKGTSYRVVAELLSAGAKARAWTFSDQRMAEGFADVLSEVVA